MRVLGHWFDSERWEWFAAGDPEVASKAAPSHTEKNSPQTLLFQSGLTLFVPLALAALIQAILG